ncbi:MAG: hypothetical protein QMC73_14590 [Myxococcota bacterium]
MNQNWEPWSQAETGGSKLSGAVFAVVLCLLIAMLFASASLATAQPRRNDQIDRTAEAKSSELSDPDIAPEASELQAEETAEPVEPEVVFEWSKFPAVHEADLLRRWNNPLYIEARRMIDEDEVRAAKRIDADQQWQELEAYIGLISDKKRMVRYESASQMADALLRIDEGTWNALRVGGKAYDLAKSIQTVRNELMGKWRESSAGDPGVKALLDAEDRLPAVDTDSAAIRFIALIQAEESPIPAHEMGTALMSEGAGSISKVYDSLRGELKSNMKKQLKTVMQEVGRDEIDFEGKDQKVAIVAKLLEAKPSDFGI